MAHIDQLRVALSIALLLLFAPALRADDASITLTSDIGWGGYFRGDQWTPIYVTVASPFKTRNAYIEIDGPADLANAIQIRQDLGAIGPRPRTYPLYVPLHDLARTTVALIDTETLERLRTVPLQQSVAGVPAEPVDTSGLLLGISGQAGLDPLADALILAHRPGSRAAYLPQLLLPTSPRGFAPLDALILLAPDFVHLNGDQKLALSLWVRAGGTLVIWPGYGVLPIDDRLMRLLPAQYGQSQTIHTTPDECLAAGLSAGEINSRALTLVDGATTIPLLGIPNLSAAAIRRGFGLVVALPLDPSALSFADDGAAKAQHLLTFWQPLLASVPAFPKPDEVTNFNPLADAGKDPRETAIAAGEQTLGNIPTPGSFPFSTLVGLLAAMMFIVGPLDWFIIRRLGLQPWTWSTITGWFGLIAVGIASLGFLAQPAPAQFRSTRVLDQADGSIVGEELLAMISPGNEHDCKLDDTPSELLAHEVGAEIWYRPLAGPSLQRNTLAYSAFDQDYRGNHPRPLWLDPSDRRFLEAESFAAGPALLDASLTLSSEFGKSTLTGKITNNASVPLTLQLLRHRAGFAQLPAQPIPPGQSLTIHIALDSTSPFLGPIIADLANERSQQLTQILEQNDNVVCLYATADAAPPPAEFSEKSPQERHTLLVRAIVPILNNGR